MKLISVMIIALLLAGIGSAQNYMPEFTMEPGAGIEMYSTTPGDIEMWGGDLNNVTYVNSTYGWFGYPVWGNPGWIVVGSGNNGTYDNTTTHGLVSYLTSTNQQPTYTISPGYYYMESMPGFQGYATGLVVTLRERSGYLAGNHSGIYVFVEGDSAGNSQLWGMATEVHDYYNSNISNSAGHTLIGLEIANVKENATGSSYGIDIASGGNQTQTAGVRIGPRWLNGGWEASRFSDGIQITDVTRGLNLSGTQAVGIDTSYGSFYADAIRMKYDQKMAYVGTGNCYSMYNTSSSALEFVFPAGQKVLFRDYTGTVVGYVDATGFHNGAP